VGRRATTVTVSLSVAAEDAAETTRIADALFAQQDAIG